MDTTTHDTEPEQDTEEPVAFTTSDLPEAPEHEQPGPAAQADADEQHAADEPEEDDAAGFDLDESNEERTRRLARERQAAKRERDAFAEWQARNAEDAAADGRIAITRDPEAEHIAAERDPDPRGLVAQVVTATGLFGFEPPNEHNGNSLADTHRAAKLIAVEYGNEFDGADIVTRLAALEPGSRMILPGGADYVDAERARIAAADARRVELDAEAQAARDAAYPEDARTAPSTRLA